MVDFVAPDGAGRGEYRLVGTGQRLELHSTSPGAAATYVEFVRGPLGYARRRNPCGAMFRAMGSLAEHARVLDATAGFGADAFRLALRGHHVLALERSPIVFALLEDGLRRALQDEETCQQLGGRLRIQQVDAIDFLKGLASADTPDVIYLDPMYPARRKSALPRVEMRVMREIVGDDPDSGELLALARSVARRRVVVKRARLAPPLGQTPSHRLMDATTRYDVYLSAEE